MAIFRIFSDLRQQLSRGWKVSARQWSNGWIPGGLFPHIYSVETPRNSAQIFCVTWQQTTNITTRQPGSGLTEASSRTFFAIVFSVRRTTAVTSVPMPRQRASCRWYDLSQNDFDIIRPSMWWFYGRNPATTAIESSFRPHCRNFVSHAELLLRARYPLSVGTLCHWTWALLSSSSSSVPI